VNIEKDDWLSAVFGHPIFRINMNGGNLLNEKELDESIRMLERHTSSQHAAMYYTKIGADQVRVARRLGQAGLYIVDTNIRFGLQGSVSLGNARLPKDLLISEAVPEHHDRVLAIASSCFRYSRFHLDPLVSKTVADQIKHDWVLSYINRQRGDKLFVALMQDRPVGFIAILLAKQMQKLVGIVDLIGVDPMFQGQGIGGALLMFVITEYLRRCDSLQVGTQVANIGSMRLLEKFGFSVIESKHVMHMHISRNENR
jgi:GNAT superfamily N-acetyltransferase